jgi:hypothetical protein
VLPRRRRRPKGAAPDPSGVAVDVEHRSAGRLPLHRAQQRADLDEQASAAASSHVYRARRAGETTTPLGKAPVGEGRSRSMAPSPALACRGRLASPSEVRRSVAVSGCAGVDLPPMLRVGDAGLGSSCSPQGAMLGMKSPNNPGWPQERSTACVLCGAHSGMR